jgi:tetratricopeptide (TPR) repeat protein
MIKSAIASLGLCILVSSTALQAHPGVDAALSYFSEQIRAQPQDQSLYLQRGSVYSNDGQYPEAQVDFERAAGMGDRVLASFDLGVLYYRQGDFKIARRNFDEYLQRFPNNISCLEYRARLLRDAGEYDAAVADFRRLFAVQQHPNPGHFLAVADILSKRGEAGIDQALVILDEGSLKLGITPQLQYQAIRLELLRDQPLAAVERLRSLQPALGQSPEWKIYMGELLLSIGNPEQAKAMLDAASGQLIKLRKTPARLESIAKINRLRGEFEVPVVTARS